MLIPPPTHSPLILTYSLMLPHPPLPHFPFIPTHTTPPHTLSQLIPLPLPPLTPTHTTPPHTLSQLIPFPLFPFNFPGVDRVENFPFPTPPSPDALASACACLTALSACDRTSGLLTPLGRAMACFPVPPRHARMILEVLAGYQPGEGLGLGSKGGARGEGDEGGDGWVGAGLGGAGGAGGATESGAGTGSAERIVLVENVLPYAVAMAAVLSVDSPFVHLDAPAVGTEVRGKGLWL